jgi:Ser/Thr protein kinase RdoA (MazF antagonist)
LAAAEWQLVEPKHDPPWHALAKQAWDHIARYAFGLPTSLGVWAERTVRVQPCLCDIWHDHVLFEGDTVSGLIDFGSVKWDHVAVDVARLLGSLVGDDAEGWATGLAAYRSVRRFTDEDEKLAHFLDRTGVVVGAMNWLLWLYQEERRFEDDDGVAKRLGVLVGRLEKMN